MNELIKTYVTRPSAVCAANNVSIAINQIAHWTGLLAHFLDTAFDLAPKYKKHSLLQIENVEILFLIPQNKKKLLVRLILFI